jgi:hypothetical protein
MSLGKQNKAAFSGGKLLTNHFFAQRTVIHCEKQLMTAPQGRSHAGLPEQTSASRQEQAVG